MEPAWQDWTRTNLSRGVPPDTVAQTLRAQGFAEADIAAIFGQAGFTLKSAVRPVSPLHERFAKVRLTTRKQPDLTRVRASKLQLYLWRNFLSAQECDALVAVSLPLVRPSTITTQNADPTFRTSSSCDLDHAHAPIVSAIDTKISEAIGIGAGYGEPIQAQVYEVGQEFRAHTDYFEPDRPEYAQFAGERGQRTWTFMIFLNDVDGGGHTHFTAIDHKVKPKRGRAVIWNNLTASGAPNPATMHHGTPVTEGRKIIITKWFRDRGTGAAFLD